MLIAQTQVRDQLLSMARSNRMSHAQILLGPEGAGGLALALEVARFLVCTDKKEGGSCGKCAGCVKSFKNIHPDIHFSFPTVGSKVTSENFMKEWREAITENSYFNAFEWLGKIGGEGKQGNITALECNRIISRLSLKSFENPNKILIIWLPEYLGKEGNRLLKLIEEPPENTFFLLVAHNTEDILNTILSRCQLTKYNALSDSEIADALVAQKELSKEEAQSVAQLAEGNFQEALSILALSNDESDTNRSSMFLDWLRKCYLGDGVAMTKWVETFAKEGREPQKFFLRYGLHFLREFLFLKTTGSEKVRLLPTELKTARNMMKVLDFEKVEKIAQLFSDCIYHVERNANPKILFLDASIQLNKIFKDRI